MPEGLPVESNLPSTARLNLMRQGDHLVLHVLHAVPVKRGGSPRNPQQSIEIIEDVLPLHGVDLSVRVPEPVARAVNPLTEAEVPVTMDGEYARLHLDVVSIHEMLVLETECGP
jgi:hypothetical protein